uniref:ATP BINDING PROTEIN-D65V n=1 Tax=synthetic construct TaxID=32630 RepID=UPI0001E3065D|nr:Chain A, ATP BINDING PROTEIN-D65V [synthetic construct]3LT9_A Chain A, ATP BINDING PROTEIN-D65V [synthetic construct]
GSMDYKDDDDKKTNWLKRIYRVRPCVKCKVAPRNWKVKNKHLRIYNMCKTCFNNSIDIGDDTYHGHVDWLMYADSKEISNT